MNWLTLDTETRFGDDYTLKKMSTEHYVRDERFKMHMVGIKQPGHACQIFTADSLLNDPALRALIQSSAVIAQHAHFDGLILSHHFNLRPKLWIDTLSMARLVLPGLKSHSLGAVATHYALPEKNVPYNLFKNVRDLPPEIYRQVAEGCAHDCALTEAIAFKLLPLVPRDELTVIDQTIRMFTEPVLQLDRPRMETFLQSEKRRKAAAMLKAGAALGLPPFDPATGLPGLMERLETIEAQLQSSAQFRIALEALGHPCPTKWSDKATRACEDCRGTGRELGHSAEDYDHDPPECRACNGSGKLKGGHIPAIAKSDDEMKDLLEHDDTQVQALASARLGVKSTIDETRAERLLDAHARGALPVYLAYAAAKTLRFGGGDKTNWQNFRRGGEIRKSIKAPEGYKLVIGDLSQIEYRLLCWVAGQIDKLDALKSGRDLYSELATDFYGYAVSKALPKERGLGKQITLSCGYGSGQVSIQSTAASGGYGPSVVLTDVEALRARDLYRSSHARVPEFWRWCEWALGVLANKGNGEYLPPGAPNALLRIADGRIELPNGTFLNYTSLRWAPAHEIFPGQSDDGEGPCWWEKKRHGWSRIWGSKLCADIIQALAAVIIKSVMVKMAHAGHRTVLQVHDEWVGLALAEQANAVFELLIRTMKAAPAWCADIPLDAEGIVSDIYEK